MRRGAHRHPPAGRRAADARGRRSGGPFGAGHHVPAGRRGDLAGARGKAGARAAINTSPEPFTNVAASTIEDIVTGGLLFAAYQYPEVAIGIAAVLLALAVALLLLARRVLRALFGTRKRVPPVP